MNGAGRPERRRQTQAERVASVPPGSEVTSVRSVPNQPGRVRVRVGGVSLTMSIEDASSLGLAKGVAWTPALAAHAEEVIAYDGARRDAMAMLARAPLSRRRLAERLTRKGHPAGAIERAAEHAERLGLIDDAALAESAARSIVARRPAGRRLVEAKLRQRGVDGATARAAAERALEDRDPMEDALRPRRRQGPIAAGGPRRGRAPPAPLGHARPPGLRPGRLPRRHGAGPGRRRSGRLTRWYTPAMRIGTTTATAVAAAALAASGCNSVSSNDRLTIGATSDEGVFIELPAFTEETGLEPTLEPSLRGVDRGHWQRRVVAVPRDRTTHWVNLTTHGPDYAEPPMRASGAFPDGDTALETEGNVTAQIGQATAWPGWVVWDVILLIPRLFVPELESPTHGWQRGLPSDRPAETAGDADES